MGKLRSGRPVPPETVETANGRSLVRQTAAA